VIGANVRFKFHVALQLEVAHHFIERFAGGRARRNESPAAFGATKTPKTLLLNPYHPPAHGRISRFRFGVSGACSIMLLQFSKFAPEFF
jgi:hypothetical protein